MILSVRVLALMVLTAFLSACASTGGPSPKYCALVGAALGGGGGAVAGAKNDSGDDVDEAVGFGAAGALVGGALGYALCAIFQKEEAPPPPPAPKPPPPPPPPPPAVKPPPPPPPDPCAGVVRLRGVNFDFDKAVIRSDAAVILDEAVNQLRRCTTKPVRIVGHTDSTGPEQYNQGLSERRAEAVKRFLAERGVSARQLSATGFGETRPIASNATRDGRALNRRVELQFVE